MIEKQTFIDLMKTLADYYDNILNPLVGDGILPSEGGIVGYIDEIVNILCEELEPNAPNYIKDENFRICLWLWDTEYRAANSLEWLYDAMIADEAKYRNMHTIEVLGWGKLSN